MTTSKTTPARSPQRPKVLFFAPILEYPPAGGPQISVINAIKVLHQIAELHIVTTIPAWQLAGKAEAFLRQHCTALVHAPSAAVTSRQPLADRILRKLRREAGYLVAPADVGFIETYGEQHGIDIFWIDRVLEHAFSVFSLLRKRRPSWVIVGDTEAVHSRFILREVPLLTSAAARRRVTRHGQKVEAQERQLVATADAVTAVSTVDIDYYQSLTDRPEKVHLFSNVIDVDDYEDRVTPPADMVPGAFLLLGSYGRIGSPMDRAASWMAEEVMPLVWQRVPEAHLHIIGRNADKTQAGLRSERISVTGKVPSVVGYLQNAAATLVPLRYESGTRFKIVESGAAGVACISTVLGAEGLEVVDGQSILIADDAADFAESMVKIYQDQELRRRLATNLKNLVLDRYSLQRQKHEGQAIVDSLWRS